MAEPEVILSAESPHLLEAWKTSEEVAMHFNNLLMGFRLKAIGGIAIGATIAFGLNFKGIANQGTISGIFAVLAVIWALIGTADVFYYYRLLAGAVDELLRLERQLGDVCLSHQIERRVHGGRPAARGTRPEDLACFQGATGPPRFPSWPIWVFYSLSLLLLIILSACFASGCWPAATHSSGVESVVPGEMLVSVAGEPVPSGVQFAAPSRPSPATVLEPPRAIDTDLVQKVDLLENKLASLNMLVSVAGIVLGAVVVIGTVGSIFSLFQFERRTKEAHGLAMSGDSASQQRAAEVHQSFLGGSVQTLNLVNATLELAKEASERAASFLENKARETSDALDSDAKALIADVSQADDRALVEGEKRSSKILSLGTKISGFEINRFVLPQDFKLTPHCLFIRGMDFHLNQQFEDAIEHWGKVALDEKADSNLRSRAWYWMGYELNNLGDFTGAVRRFASALELAKGSRAYEIRRIRLESRFFAGEQPAELIGPIEALLHDIETDTLCDSEELAVRKRKTAVTLGNLYHMQGEAYRSDSDKENMTKCYEKAIECFELAKEQEKWARSGLAEAHYRLGERDKAINQFRFVRNDAQAELINRVEKRTKTLARATELLCCVRVPEWNREIQSMHSQVVQALGEVGERLTVYSQWQRRNVEKKDFIKHVEQFETEASA